MYYEIALFIHLLNLLADMAIWLFFRKKIIEFKTFLFDYYILFVLKFYDKIIV